MATSLLAAGATLFCGCTSEKEMEDNLTEGLPSGVNISIGSLRSETSAGEENDVTSTISDNEKINTWWLAFVDKNGDVVKIIDRESTTAATTAVEEETFKCILPSGKYDIYAFANIDADELTAATGGLSFEEKKAIIFPTGITKLDDVAWSVSLNNWGSDKPLPMSGFLKGVTVRNTVEEKFSIEVVRMAAKIDFLFSNSGDEDITVNSISIDPVTLSSISLFPLGPSGISYDHLGKSAYTPIEDSEQNYDRVMFDPSTDDVKFKVKSGDSKIPKSFYIQESLSLRKIEDDYIIRENDEAFTIGINVTHTDGVADFEQYNITRDILSYINRNDRIVIPISLSRYDVSPEAVFYPPIGGYPAVASTTDPKGANIFTFESKGDFAVVVNVTDKQTERHLAPQYYKLTVKNIEDENSIFTTKGVPTVTSGSAGMPDEITGSLSSSTGKASFELEVNIYDKPFYETGAKASTYTRKIYIIRK